MWWAKRRSVERDNADDSETQFNESSDSDELRHSIDANSKGKAKKNKRKKNKNKKNLKSYDIESPLVEHLVPD